MKHKIEYLISLPFGAVFLWMDKNNLLPDWSFLLVMIVLVVIDTILGIVYAIKSRQFSSKGFGGVLVKLLIYILVVWAANLVAHFKIHGEPTDLLHWVEYVVYSAVAVREFMSIVENAAKIKPDRIPLWLRKRLADFDDDGKINDSAQ